MRGNRNRRVGMKKEELYRLLENGPIYLDGCIGWYCCFILCRWDISISDVSVLYDLVQILLAMDFWEIR